MAPWLASQHNWLLISIARQKSVPQGSTASSKTVGRAGAPINPDSEGRPDSGADSKQFVLLTCSSDVEAAAAWDLAILWRDHHLPAMKKKVLTPNFSTSRYHAEPGLLQRLYAAPDVHQLKALLKQLRDDATLMRLAQGPTQDAAPAAAGAGAAPGRPGAAAAVALAAPAAAQAPLASVGQGPAAAAAATESPAAGKSLPAGAPGTAVGTGAAAGARRGGTKRHAAALADVLTAGVLAQKAAAGWSVGNAEEGVEAPSAQRARGRRAEARPDTPAGTKHCVIREQKEQQQQQRAGEGQEQQRRQQQQREPQREAACGAAHRHQPVNSPYSTSDDEVVIVSQTTGLSSQRGANTAAPASAARGEPIAEFDVRQEAGCVAAMGAAVNTGLAAVGAAVCAPPAVPAGTVHPPAVQVDPHILPAPPPPPQQQQVELGAAAAPANLHPATVGVPARAVLPAVEAASNTCALPALLLSCCDNPQAEAVGLTPELVGAFMAAYSGHFSAVQRQDAADFVKALMGAGHFKAMKSYLEGMVQRYGVTYK